MYSSIFYQLTIFIFISVKASFILLVMVNKHNSEILLTRIFVNWLFALINKSVNQYQCNLYDMEN